MTQTPTKNKNMRKYFTPNKLCNSLFSLLNGHIKQLDLWHFLRTCRDNFYWWNFLKPSQCKSNWIESLYLCLHQELYMHEMKWWKEIDCPISECIVMLEKKMVIPIVTSSWIQQVVVFHQACTKVSDASW